MLVILAVTVAGVAAAQTPGGATCDLDVVRARAEASYPGYRVEVGRDHGVVTLRFTPKSDGAFAIALRAVGTRLSTSLMAAGAVDEAERGRLAEPVATWWQDTDLQRMIATCTAAVPDAAQMDLGAAARTALQPEMFHGRWHVAMLLGVAWIVLAALLFSGLLKIAQSPAERVALLVLFACALALNGWLCVGGPGDTRLNLAAFSWGDQADLRWGPAPVELFRLLAFLLGGIDDVRIRAVNLVLSSLVPVVAYAMITELGIGKVAAFVAAVMTAAHPLSIAFSADLGRQPTYLFAAFGSVLGLLQFLARGGVTAISAFVLGTILAVMSRPEGAHVLILDAAILLFAPATLRRRGAVGVVFALLATLAFVYVRHFLEYGGLLGNETHASSADPATLLWTVVLSREFTPLAWIVVWTLGLILGIRARAAWVAIAFLIVLHIAWSATGLYDSFVGYDRQVAGTRYESVLLLPFGIGTALFVESVLALQSGVALTIAAAVTVLTLLTYPLAYETMLRPFTIDYEYRFLRRHILTLPRESRVYVLQSPVNDIGFVDASFVGLFVRRELRFDVWNPLQRAGLPSGPGTYLYIGSSCAPLADQRTRPLGADFPRWLESCESIRNRLAGRAVEEIEVPARKISWWEYTEPTVRLGLYGLPPS